MKLDLFIAVGEFEEVRPLGEALSFEGADAKLKIQKTPWQEAVLREFEPNSGDAPTDTVGWRIKARRFPRSKWVAARTWPSLYDARAIEVPSLEEDVAAHCAWLRALKLEITADAAAAMALHFQYSGVEIDPVERWVRAVLAGGRARGESVLLRQFYAAERFRYYSSACRQVKRLHEDVEALRAKVCMLESSPYVKSAPPDLPELISPWTSEEASDRRTLSNFSHVVTKAVKAMEPFNLQLTEARLRREPWRGRERGSVCGANCLEPNESIRSALVRKSQTPLALVVGLLLQDGMERGAVEHYVASRVYEAERLLAVATDHEQRLDTEQRILERQIHVLQGGTEASFAQQEAQDRAQTLAAMEEILRRAEPEDPLATPAPPPIFVLEERRSSGTVEQDLCDGHTHVVVVWNEAGVETGRKRLGICSEPEDPCPRRTDLALHRPLETKSRALFYTRKKR
jgi:hypothetical protein